MAGVIMSKETRIYVCIWALVFESDLELLNDVVRVSFIVS